MANFRSAAAFCGLIVAGCGNGSPMDVKDCSISGSPSQSRFTAVVFDRSEKPVANVALKAATTGRIVIGNGDNIVDYEVSQRIAPGVWTRISTKNRYRAGSFSECTVSHVTFADGTYWAMPTPEF